MEVMKICEEFDVEVWWCCLQQWAPPFRSIFWERPTAS